VANDSPLADVAIGTDHGARANADARGDDYMGLDADAFTEDDIRGNDGGGMNTRLISGRRRGEEFRYFSEAWLGDSTTIRVQENFSESLGLTRMAAALLARASGSYFELAKKET
jgi:hypothetical protein